MLLFLTVCISQIVLGQTLEPTRDVATFKYGYKEEGKMEWSLPPIYKEAGSFKGKLAIVNDGESEYVINLHGERVSPEFASVDQIYAGNILSKTYRDFMPFICKDKAGKYNLT